MDASRKRLLICVSCAAALLLTVPVSRPPALAVLLALCPDTVLQMPETAALARSFILVSFPGVIAMLKWTFPFST